VIHGVGFASYGRFKSTIVKIKNKKSLFKVPKK
jgi:hypothetical protein